MNHEPTKPVTTRWSRRSGPQGPQGTLPYFRGPGQRRSHTLDERGQPPYYEVDEARHDKTVSLVDRMLRLHKDMSKARTAPEKTAIERQRE
jgi:hypothetical protein